MNIDDAINVLGLSGDYVSNDDIKLAYRKAAFKYHPDRNPAGLEMMKLINAAYEALKDFSGEVTHKTQENNYSEKLNKGLSHDTCKNETQASKFIKIRRKPNFMCLLR